MPIRFGSKVLFPLKVLKASEFESVRPLSKTFNALYRLFKLKIKGCVAHHVRIEWEM